MSGSFFRNLAVTYWTAQIYNSGYENIKAEIDEEFSSALLDAASNYVCAVERMELSGNNIFYYSVSSDPEYDTLVYLNSMNVRYVSIFIMVNQNVFDAVYEIRLYGNYFNLGQLIEDINNQLKFNLNNQTCPWLTFSLTADGKIRAVIDPDEDNVDYIFGPSLDPQKDIPIMFRFSSSRLASIFGLPQIPDINAETWFQTYSTLTNFRTLGFETKTSRIDCGEIPTMIQLRSTMPLESDQVSNAKTNIVTDFNIVANTTSSYSISQKTTVNIPQPLNIAEPTMSIKQTEGSALGLGMGGMLVYIPQERRWLNFSAPIGIYNIRIWVDLVYNNPDAPNTQYYIPPGGKFSIKIGFYLRN